MKLLGKITDSKDLVSKQYVDTHSGVSSVNGKSGAVVLKAADVDAAPIWESAVTYAAGAWVVHNGYLWRNTSGAASTGVEPGTNYNVWNVNYSNRNLLNNSFFTINQRGQTSHSGKGYFVDRWKSSNSAAVFTIEENMITLSNNGSNSFFRQVLENPLSPHVVYTLSFLIKGNAKGYISFNYSQDTTIVGQVAYFNSNYENWSNVFLTLEAPAEQVADMCSIRCDGGYTFQICAAKLEKGAISTIVNDTVHDYGTESIKCITSTADPEDTYANKTLLTT